MAIVDCVLKIPYHTQDTFSPSSYILIRLEYFNSNNMFIFFLFTENLTYSYNVF